MSYQIRKGSIVIAVRRDGRHEAKQITKDRVYPGAYKDGDWLSFPVRPGAAWTEFRAKREDVDEILDIVNIPDGTYTVVLDADISYVTLKLETGKEPLHENGNPNFFFGKQIVSFLSGPDNENNFTGFAHLDEHGIVHLWKKFRDQDMSRYQTGLALLQELGGEGQKQAGFTYAMRSKRCWKCNRKLTVPVSLHRGMGPVCARGGIDEG